MDEYETRLQAAFAAHTTADLRQLVADLPLAQLRRNDPRRREARRRAAAAASSSIWPATWRWSSSCSRCGSPSG